MYPVTQAYRDSMAKDIRGGVTVEADLLNIDAFVQAGMYVYGDLPMPGCDPGGVAAAAPENVKDIATFELNYLRTDGSQVFPEAYTSNYYISEFLSSETPNSAGTYPISAGFTVEFSEPWSFGAQPVTILMDDAAGRITVTMHYYASLTSSTLSHVTRQIDAVDGVAIFDPLPGISRYAGADVTINTLCKPLRRARVRKVYAGTRQLLTADQIVSLKYSDENDCIGMELPTKTISLSIDNLDRKYDQETEYDNPTFHPLHTQLYARVGYDVHDVGSWEWVRMPGMYLSAYQVDDQAVQFDFEDAIGRLNEDDSIHYYDRPYTTGDYPNVEQRIKNVVWLYIHDELVVNLIDEVRGRKVETTPERLGIRIDTAAARNMSMTVRNPCPPVKAAQALQLCANLSGNIVRSRRTGDELEVCAPTAAPLCHISADEMYEYPKFERDYVVTGTDVEAYDLRARDGRERVVVDEDALPNAVTSVDCDYPIQVTVMGHSGQYYDYLPPYFAYRDYRAQGTTGGMDAWLDGFQVYEVVKEHITGSYISDTAEGRTLKLSNPLCNKAIAASYASTVLDERQYNVSADLSHRGFPELDAGDVITFESETKASVKGRIIRNEFEISSAGMKGSTKVRRLE